MGQPYEKDILEMEGECYRAAVEHYCETVEKYPFLGQCELWFKECWKTKRMEFFGFDDDNYDYETRNGQLKKGN
jgi:hypothetical protein